MQPTSAAQSLFAQLANATWSYSQRRWQLVVVAMLLLLHVAVFRGVADPWARALLLAHLGFLLLWQPLKRAEERVSAIQGAIVLLVAVVVMLRLDWWLLAFWVVALVGLVAFALLETRTRTPLSARQTAVVSPETPAPSTSTSGRTVVIPLPYLGSA